jgi:hypothetical protein
MITKAEAYKHVIEITKKTGQGLSGIVKALGSDTHLWGKYLDELIDEGLVEVFDDGTTIGHPESARWYMPTKGYNLWKDGIANGPGNRFDSSRFLTHVRLYLGCVDDRDEVESDDKDANLKRWLHPSAQMLMQSHEFMKGYAEWLERNHEALEEMKNLSTIYEGATPLELLIDGDMDWIKSKRWYKENLKVSECLQASKDQLGNDKEWVCITKEIIKLMEKDDKYQDEANKQKNDLVYHTKDIERRERANTLLMSLDQDGNIAEEISNAR